MSSTLISVLLMIAAALVASLLYWLLFNHRAVSLTLSKMRMASLPMRKVVMLPSLIKAV